MPVRDPEGMPVTKLTPNVTFEDVKEMLRLAEGLQEKCESLSQRMLFWMLEMASSLLFAVGCLVSAVMDRDEILVGFRLLFGFFAFFSLPMLIYGLFNFYSVRADRRRDRRALFAIVDMLREVDGPLTEPWSALQTAEFRIRMARLVIGPGWPG